ncbi:hypothetical protein BIW22_24910 [Salmonella enterica]|nr:hypothetical protein [Salmonella enterica]
MPQVVAGVRAGVSVNANSDWVVFTGKLPQAIKVRLKVAAARMGKKQQDILAEAVEAWMNEKGL